MFKSGRLSLGFNRTRDAKAIILPSLYWTLHMCLCT